jgi:hypothetical protein
VDPNLLKTFLPVVVIVVVLALRMRSMSKVRPLKLNTLWVVPAMLVALAAVTLFINPPGLAALSISAVALIAGGLIGWQRGKLIRIERDPASGDLTQRASPAAMILLIAIIGIRYAARTYFDATPGADGQMSAQTLLITDALLMFADGLIAMTRIEMGLRARRIMAGGEQPSEV